MNESPSVQNTSTLSDTAMEVEASPIFILSCERSGSTMLRYIIDTHSEVACAAHLYLGRLCADLNTVLLGTLAQIESGTREYDERRRWAVLETRRTIQGIMDTYVRAKGKKVWCEKTPMNIEFLAQLAEHFPDARYICLYRQCMDVVVSCLNRSRYTFLPEHIPYVNRNPGNILAAMVENWAEKTETMLGLEARNGEHCYRAKYESIVTRPEETLPSLFRFIGVDWEDGLIERVFKSDHDAGEGDGKASLSSRIRGNTVGRGVEVPRSGVPERLLERADALLCKLGYPLLDEYYAAGKNRVDDEGQPKQRANGDLVGMFENRLAGAIKNKGQYPGLSGVWKVVVTDEPKLCWIVDLSGPEVVIKRGDFVSESTIGLSSHVLREVLAGRMDPALAFSQGDISFEGDEASVLSFGRLLLWDDG